QCRGATRTLTVVAHEARRRPRASRYRSPGALPRLDARIPSRPRRWRARHRRDAERRERGGVRCRGAGVARGGVRKLPGAAGALVRTFYANAGAGRKTAFSAMIGTSPSSVVRYIRRLYFVSSNAVAQCCVQRLSHSSASPTFHLWRETKYGSATEALRG